MFVGLANGEPRRYALVNRLGQTAALTQPAVITDNVLTGHAPVGDPSIQAHWGFGGGIVEGTGVTGVVDDVERNQINTAYMGIQLRGGVPTAAVSVTAQDNQITNVYLAWTIQQSWDVLTAHRNDISAYVYPITALQYGSPATLNGGPPVAPPPTASSLTCNWWGSASGPVNMWPGALVTVYTPFATTPIAGQPSVACTP